MRGTSRAAIPGVVARRPWIPFPFAPAALRPGMTNKRLGLSSPAARSAGTGIQGHGAPTCPTNLMPPAVPEP